MKQKNKLEEPATKKDLQAVEESLRGEIKLSADETLVKVDEKAREYRDQILTSNDKLAETLETMREELEIGSFQMKGRIDNHEERIKILEKIQQTA